MVSILLTAIIFIGTSSDLKARQNTKKAGKYFEKAIDLYNSNQITEAENYALLTVKTDSTFLNAYMLLADISDELKKINQHEWALLKVIEIDSVNVPLAYKLLALSYFERGRFNNALLYFNKYSKFEIQRDSALVSHKIEECINANRLLENKHNLEIIHLDTSINTSENEYWPFISADDSILYFTRLITSEKRYVFERLFYSKRDFSKWSDALKFTIGDNTEVNEGTVSMTADGRIIFFTACGRFDGKGSCDIYYMINEDGMWLAPRNAGSVVNTVYWDAQPSISVNGDFLYWSSNRPGGYGGKDIWGAQIKEIDNGKLIFDRALNMGKTVNSVKNDYSPFIHADNKTLYYASEGWMGLGKSDLFFSRFEDNNWTAAQNMGFPINSFDEDDGLVVSPTAHLAFLASNRKSSIKNSKDIYQFKLPDEFMPQRMGYVKGFVMDKHSNKKLNVKIELTELGSSKSTLIAVDDETGYITTLAHQNTYAFNIATPGYLFYSRHFDLKESNKFEDATVFNIYLEPIKEDIKVILKNVFFDFGSFQLKAESEAELNNVIEFLKLNPSVKIEISGHTDNVGDDGYNQTLSENRAKVIRNFLIKAIDPNRITFKGLGSSMPIELNETELGRSKNRRSELKIISY